MSHTLTLQQLTDKVSQLEEELSFIRRELAELQQVTANAHSIPAESSKQEQKLAIHRMFTDLKISGSPIGALSLQKKMRRAHLTDNELSHGIVIARDE